MKGCLITLGVIIAMPIAWMLAEVVTRSEMNRPDASVEATAATPSGLATAFSANELAAGEKYESSPVSLTGDVGRVALNFTGGAVVDLTDGRASVSAHMLDSEKEWVSRLQVGSRITLRCTDPSYALGIVILRHCIAGP